jgi:hypothetical protein
LALFFIFSKMPDITLYHPLSSQEAVKMQPRRA